MNPVRRVIGLAVSATLLAVCGSVWAQDLRSQLKGQVFEAEEWSTPAEAWVTDQHPADKWCLWTQEPDVLKKRSGGQSLQSPAIKEDRQKPEDGAPPLHTHITGLTPGIYQVRMNNPIRNIAISFDGTTWAKREPTGELDLGVRRIADGTFDVWVDDRYVMPGQPGSCYYDYLRFEPLEAPAFSRLMAFMLPDGRTQISWVTDKPVATGTVAYGTDGNLDQRAAEDLTGMRNHAVILPPLPAGKRCSAQIRIGVDGDDVFQSPTLEFVAGERPQPPASRPLRVALSVAEPTAFPRTSWPVTSGVPFAQGQLARAEDVCLVDAKDAAIPAQLEVLSHWPDGSVKWLLVDFQATTVPGAVAEYALAVGRASSGAAPLSPLVRDTATGFVVDTGAMAFNVAREQFALFDQVAVDKNGDGACTADEQVTGTPNLGNGRLIDATGKAYGLGKPDLVQVEAGGPLRATVRVEGDFRAEDGSKLFRYRARLTAYRGQRVLRLQWTIGNDNTAAELTPISGAGLRLPIRGQGAVTGSLVDAEAVSITGEDDLWVTQDYDNHFTRHAGAATTEGERDPGLARVTSGDATITAVIRDFWQTYPKSVAVKPDGLDIRLLPPLPATQYTSEADRADVPMLSLYYPYKEGKYQFKRGLEYTADVRFRFDVNDSPAVPATAAQFQQPLFAMAAPEVYCGSGAFWRVEPRAAAEFPEYWAAFEESFRNLEKARQTQREYGWMNYGDWWGERAWNWGNNEYDLAYLMAVTYAQTADLTYLWRGDQMARHYTSIDTVHYPWSKPMRELVYEHSVGHVGGFFAKDDPRINNQKWEMGWAVVGAMDGSGGHTFEGGNFLYGFLTGDRRYLEVAETACWNQATQYTPRFNFGIERACGWSLYNAMSAYGATLNPYYLNAALIYMEKVYELQDPVTGGWRMHQDQSECDCPDKKNHIGGKAFASGVLLHGLVMVDQAAPDPRIQKSIARACDWLLDYSWNEEKKGFRYKTGCPKYQDSGWYTPLVTDGIAYAYEVTKDARYKDFLLRTLPAAVQNRTGSGRAAGKSFTSQFRALPHTLSMVKSWGVTALPLPPRICDRHRVFLDEAGRANFAIRIENPAKTPLACEAKVTQTPPNVRVEPASQAWNAAPGSAAGPEFTVTAAAGAEKGELRLTCQAGTAAPREMRVAVIPYVVLTPIGTKLGFVGPADHYSLKALQESGAELEIIPDLAAADLTAYRGLVIGSDVLGRKELRIADAVSALVAFVRGGGRLVLLQINDGDWQIDLLPSDLDVQDADGKAGKILAPAHPLFRDVATIEGLVSFDTIAAAAPTWTVLAADNKGRPSIVTTKLGSGEILVVEPSPDRWPSPEKPDVGLPEPVCRQFMRNLAEWLAGAGK